MAENIDKKIQLYIDTSVPSAFYDTSKPLRQLITQKWFENDAELYELFISTIAIDEIEEIKNIEKRQSIKNLIIEKNVQLIELSEAAVELAKEYIQKEAIPKSEPEDANHIAIASVNNLDALASWNFKHIVSVNPIRKVHEINLKYGYSIIAIGSLQIFGGSKYGNL